ncbi:hypothetical protein AB205_0119270 [Aquarana catesbeiana]|uniref:Uncharacterized protein n=1 Tax=Aquarana catesbeiana TaxID=8400 RepID=A0A2G9S909_AQUCT|nr:hypothetical protein AB205_0119270 [Aquarana catesbeiana]
MMFGLLNSLLHGVDIVKTWNQNGQLLPQRLQNKPKEKLNWVLLMPPSTRVLPVDMESEASPQ